MEVIMMIAAPGAGKTTMAKEFESMGYSVVSSDAIREVLLDGKPYDPAINKEVFAKVISDTVAELAGGKNVLIDATNLNGKRRASMISEIKGQAAKAGMDKGAIEFIAHPLYVSMQELFLRDLWRDESIGSKGIVRLLKSFTYPKLEEGFTEIVSASRGNQQDDHLTHDMGTMFHQDNVHHRGTLEQHIQDVVDKIDMMHAAGEIDDIELSKLGYVAVKHDLGKLYTKTFIDFDGNKSDNAHYYGHQNLSTYIAATDLYGDTHVPEEYFQDILFLIENHMADLTVNKKIYKQNDEEVLNLLAKFQEADKWRGE